MRPKSNQASSKRAVWTKVSLYLLFIVILSLPMQFGKHFFFPFSYIFGVRVDYLAPTIYLTDALIVAIILLRISTIVKNIYKKSTVIFLIFLLLNIALSTNKQISLYVGLRFIEVYFFFIAVRRTTISSRFILLGLALSSFFELALGLGQFVLKKSLQGVFYFFGERYFTLSTPGIAKASLRGVEILRPYGTFSHPNSMAGFYLLIYIFVLTTSFFEKRKILRPVVLIISTFLVFLSFSKTAIFTLALLTIIYLWRRGFAKKCVFCFVARCTGLVVCALLFFLFTSDPLSLEKRVVLLGNAVSIISSHWFAGVGLGAYLMAQAHFPAKYVDFLNQPVHNTFALFFAETGLVIGGLFSFFLLRRLFPLIKRYPYVFGVVLITGMFDHYWLTLEQNTMVLIFVLSRLSV